MTQETKTAQPEPVNVKMLSALRKVWSEGVIPDAYADLQDEVCNAIAAAEEAQPAPAQAVPLTDEQIEADFQRAGGRWNGNCWSIEDADLHPYVRGITGEPKHG